jgi:hypothetical protein
MAGGRRLSEVVEVVAALRGLGRGAGGRPELARSPSGVCIHERAFSSCRICTALRFPRRSASCSVLTARRMDNTMWAVCSGRRNQTRCSYYSLAQYIAGRIAAWSLGFRAISNGIR